MALAALLLACATPAKEPPPPAKEPPPPAKEPPPAVAGSGVVPAAKTEPRPAAAPSELPAAASPAESASRGPPEPVAAAATPPTGSAYFGCGEAIPSARLWDETTESQVLEAISVAKQCAAANGRRLLLEFVAPWCADCREMAKLDESAVVSETLRARFERVRINVGKWDRHEALRDNFKVRALATYIVIDPKTSRVLAQTTLEPVTRTRGKKLTAEDWARWLAGK